MPEKNSGDYRRDCSLSAPTLPNPHYPLPRTMSLPPLSKVRCCRPKKFGRLPEGLLYTHQPLNPHNLLKSTTPSLPVPTLLPPLLKGGGLTARHKLLLCCFLFVTHPPFFIYQTFLPSRRRDCNTTALPRTNTLASPRKRGGGLTASHKPKYYSVFM